MPPGLGQRTITVRDASDEGEPQRTTSRSSMPRMGLGDPVSEAGRSPDSAPRFRPNEATDASLLRCRSSIGRLKSPAQYAVGRSGWKLKNFAGNRAVWLGSRTAATAPSGLLVVTRAPRWGGPSRRRYRKGRDEQGRRSIPPERLPVGLARSRVWKLRPSESTHRPPAFNEPATGGKPAISRSC